MSRQPTNFMPLKTMSRKKMYYTIGLKSLRKVAPELTNERAVAVARSLGEALHKFGIKDPTECAHFVAQCAHESGGFTIREEIWGPTLTQSGYWKRKEDLGNWLPYHGKLYRGRGWIQITGRANYKDVGNALHHSFLGGKAKLLGTDKYASLSAAWYWKNRVHPHLASGINLVKVTKLINGGINGIMDREIRTLRALKVKKYLTPMSR